MAQDKNFQQEFNQVREVLMKFAHIIGLFDLRSEHSVEIQEVSQSIVHEELSRKEYQIFDHRDNTVLFTRVIHTTTHTEQVTPLIKITKVNQKIVDSNKCMLYNMVERDSVVITTTENGQPIELINTVLTQTNGFTLSSCVCTKDVDYLSDHKQVHSLIMQMNAVYPLLIACLLDDVYDHMYMDAEDENTGIDIATHYQEEFNAIVEPLTEFFAEQGFALK